MRISNPLRIVSSLAFGLVVVLAGLTFGSHFNPAPPEVPYQAPRPPLPIELPPITPPAPTHASEFLQKLEKATNPLYADVDGNVRFICTATAIQKIPTGYIFLTARHCVADPRLQGWFVVIDKKSDTPYIKATVLLAGDLYTDAALLQVNTLLDIPTVPLGDERLLSISSRVEYFGFPQNLGKFYFEGYVTSLKIGPPAYSDPQWNGDLGLTIQIGPGSSGSALVDPQQEAIVGVVTGVTYSRLGGPILSMATPVSKVRVLVSDYKAGRTKSAVDVGLFDRIFGIGPFGRHN
ncbi:Trypsin-like peptidase domain protein [uncultured archaeon]|nr:Trypsin-like peptidase domain protein [uncultured archaeon]